MFNFLLGSICLTYTASEWKFSCTLSPLCVFQGKMEQHLIPPCCLQFISTSLCTWSLTCENFAHSYCFSDTRWGPKLCLLALASARGEEKVIMNPTSCNLTLTQGNCVTLRVREVEMESWLVLSYLYNVNKTTFLLGSIL